MARGAVSEHQFAVRDFADSHRSECDVTRRDRPRILSVAARVSRAGGRERPPPHRKPHGSIAFRHVRAKGKRSRALQMWVIVVVCIAIFAGLTAAIPGLTWPLYWKVMVAAIISTALCIFVFGVWLRELL